MLWFDRFSDAVQRLEAIIASSSSSPAAKKKESSAASGPTAVALLALEDSVKKAFNQQQQQQQHQPQAQLILEEEEYQTRLRSFLAVNLLPLVAEVAPSSASATTRQGLYTKLQGDSKAQTQDVALALLPREIQSFALGAVFDFVRIASHRVLRGVTEKAAASSSLSNPDTVKAMNKRLQGLITCLDHACALDNRFNCGIHALHDLAATQRLTSTVLQYLFGKMSQTLEVDSSKLLRTEIHSKKFTRHKTLGALVYRGLAETHAVFATVAPTGTSASSSSAKATAGNVHPYLQGLRLLLEAAWRLHAAQEAYYSSLANDHSCNMKFILGCVDEAEKLLTKYKTNLAAASSALLLHASAGVEAELAQFAKQARDTNATSYGAKSSPVEELPKVSIKAPATVADVSKQPTATLVRQLSSCIFNTDSSAGAPKELASALEKLIAQLPTAAVVAAAVSAAQDRIIRRREDANRRSSLEESCGQRWAEIRSIFEELLRLSNLSASSSNVVDISADSILLNLRLVDDLPEVRKQLETDFAALQGAANDLTQVTRRFEGLQDRDSADKTNEFITLAEQVKSACDGVLSLEQLQLSRDCEALSGVPKSGPWFKEAAIQDLDVFRVKSLSGLAPSLKEAQLEKWHENSSQLVLEGRKLRTMANKTTTSAAASSAKAVEKLADKIADLDKALRDVAEAEAKVKQMHQRFMQLVAHLRQERGGDMGFGRRASPPAPRSPVPTAQKKRPRSDDDDEGSAPPPPPPPNVGRAKVSNKFLAKLMQ